MVPVFFVPFDTVLKENLDGSICSGVVSKQVNAGVGTFSR